MRLVVWDWAKRRKGLSFFLPPLAAFTVTVSLSAFLGSRHERPVSFVIAHTEDKAGGGGTGFDLVVTKTPLLGVAIGIVPAFHISPDGKVTAYITGRGRSETALRAAQAVKRLTGWNLLDEYYSYGTEFVVTNGRRGRSYTEAGHWFSRGGDAASWAERDLAVSPDGKHVTYGAYRRGKWLVVVDEKESEEYDVLEEYGPIWSQHGNHAGWIAHTDGREWVVIDGVRKYCTVYHLTALALSPDGEHGAYRVEDFNGHAYVALDGRKWCDEPLPQQPAVFSPDSRRLAAVCGRAEGETEDPVVKEYVVVDGVKGPEYDSIHWEGPRFSPDGKHLVCVGYRDERGYLVFDGIEQESADRIWGYVFSADSVHFAYAAEMDGRQFLVADGKKQQEYDSVEFVAYSADGKRLVYVANSADRQFVVENGREYSRYDEIGDVVFGLSSEHLVYAARRGEKWFVVIDEEEGRPYDKVLKFVASPDDEHVAFFAERGSVWLGGSVWVAVLDGREIALDCAEALPEWYDSRGMMPPGLLAGSLKKPYLLTLSFDEAR